MTSTEARRELDLTIHISEEGEIMEFDDDTVDEMYRRGRFGSVSRVVRAMRVRQLMQEYDRVQASDYLASAKAERLRHGDILFVYVSGVDGAGQIYGYPHHIMIGEGESAMAAFQRQKELLAERTDDQIAIHLISKEDAQAAKRYHKNKCTTRVR